MPGTTRFILLISGLAAVIGVSANAHAVAKDPVVNEFEANEPKIPLQLIAKGYESIGDLNLREFVTQMQDRRTSRVAKKWVDHPEVTDAGFHMGRTLAQWSCDPTTSACLIEINRERWHLASSEIKRVTPLHEQLGIWGFADHDYQLSTGLWLLSQPEFDRLNEEQRTTIVTGLTQIAKAGPARGGGGATGVGGGGEGVGIETKIGMMHMDLGRTIRDNNTERGPKAFDRLVGDFDIKHEIQLEPGSAYPAMETTIVEGGRGGIEQGMDACIKVLRLPKTQQMQIWKMTYERFPDTRSKMPNFKAFQQTCRDLIDGKFGND